MGWATPYITKLRAGEAVSFRPRGNSMAGKIESGDLCTVVPVDPVALQVGDNRGRINGWMCAHAIFGKCVAVEA